MGHKKGEKYSFRWTETFKVSASARLIAVTIEPLMNSKITEKVSEYYQRYSNWHNRTIKWTT